VDHAQPSPPSRGKPQFPKYQQPVDGGVEHQSQQRNHHHRFGLVDAGAVAVQHAVAGECRQAIAHHPHKAFGHIAHHRVDGHGIKHQGSALGNHPGHGTHYERLPQALAHHMRHRIPLACARVAGHQRVDRHDQAHQGEDQDVPD